MRLDIFLSTKNSISRNRAQFIIQEWLVSVNNTIITKSSFPINEWDTIVVREDKKTLWVSRSAVKLADYLETYPIPIHGKKCLDIGASTGGFTQVLLSHQADSIVAIDVGSSQLHPTLKNIPNIISLENTDIRSYQSDTPFDIIVTDVSFISLKQIIPSIYQLSTPSTEIILLFKPQFEVGKNNLKKTGVPKNEAIIQSCLLDFQRWIQGEWLSILQTVPSTLKWEAWNQEYIIHCTKKHLVAK